MGSCPQCLHTEGRWGKGAQGGAARVSWVPFHWLGSKGMPAEPHWERLAATTQTALPLHTRTPHEQAPAQNPPPPKSHWQARTKTQKQNRQTADATAALAPNRCAAPRPHQSRTGRTRGSGRGSSAAGPAGTPAAHGYNWRTFTIRIGESSLFDELPAGAPAGVPVPPLGSGSQPGGVVTALPSCCSVPMAPDPAMHAGTNMAPPRSPSSHLGDVVPLDVAHAVQRHKARKGHGEVVAQRQDLAALAGGEGGSCRS